MLWRTRDDFHTRIVFVFRTQAKHMLQYNTRSRRTSSQFLSHASAPLLSPASERASLASVVGYLGK